MESAKNVPLSQDNTCSSKKISPEPSSSTNGELRTYSRYKKRSGTVDKGKEYEIVMCALYALKFGTSDDVSDFKMSTNDSECGDFDDIKLEVTYKNGTKRPYLFQLKHKQSETNITDKNLSAKPTQKNPFSLTKYFKAISSGNNNKDAIFILYTNSPTKIENGNELLLASQDSVIVKDGSNIEYKALLVNDKASTEQFSSFQFELIKNNSNLNRDVLKQFYFFPNQKNVDQVKSLLKELLEGLLQCDISVSYIQFIQDWYLGNFGLTKHNLVTKLTELALSPYIKVISDEKCNERCKPLEDAVMEHELTLIQNCEEEIVENIWEATRDHYSMLDLKKFGLTHDPPHVQKTKVLWYLGKVPLIANVDDTNKMTILSAMKLIKTNLDCKKIVLVGHVIKTDFQKEWIIFENLSDLVNNCGDKQFCRDILQNFNVSLQGRQQICLKTLIDSSEEMDTIIGTKELFIMSQNLLLIGDNQKMKLPESYIFRTISTIFLDITKTLDRCIQIEKCVLVINCSENFREKLPLQRSTVMELPKFLNKEDNQDLDNLILFSTQSKCTSIEFDLVCKKSAECDVYVLQIFDDKCGTLLLRKGNRLPLDSVKYTLEPVEEKEMFRYFNNPLNVVCAPPGMGKSTLLTNLYNTCPAEYWCIYVNLINYNASLKTLDHEQLWRHFLQLEDQDTLIVKTVNVFAKRKKIQLFLDGLDELDSDYIDSLLFFIKCASSDTANVWVSSRENLRDKILKNLNIVPLEIQELNQTQQKKYVCDRLQQKYNDVEIETIVEAIFDSADVTNSQRMLGIPLQLYIITENFLESTKSTGFLHEQNNFVLTTMYRQFFSGKKKFAYQKLGINQQEHQLGIDFNDVLRKYEVPGLQACLDKADFAKLNLDPKDNEMFVERIKSQGDKFGIIKEISKDGKVVVFDHQTYAEYFACVWLKTHLDKARMLRDELFLEKYENLRIIFDIMLGEQNPLHLAVIYRNVQQTEKNLKDFNLKDHGGRKALHLACSYGMKSSPHFEFCSVYFQHSNLPNQESESYVKIVEMLLSQCHYTLDCKDLFDFNYVNYCLRAQCLYPIEKMLEKHLLTTEDYKVFDKYYDAETLVFYACLRGYPKILSHILTYKSVSLRLLRYVYLCGCPQILSHMFKYKYGSIVHSDKFAKVSLLDVVTIGSNENNNTSRQFHKFLEVVQLLINYGINVNQRQLIFGATALLFACEQNNVEIVKKLLEKGAHINTVDNKDRNALHYATHQSSTQNTELIELLINHGIDVNARDKFGKIALHVACEQGNVEIVKKLLEKGADVNALDSEDWNVLHYASRSRTQNTELIELLVNQGISVNAKDKFGKVPLHIASERRRVKIVKVLLEKGADINALSSEHGNALHYVTLTREDTEVIDHLIDYGISINARDKSGNVPLHYASAHGSVAVMKRLLEKGADCNAINNCDKNALHYVIYSGRRHSTELLSLLIKNGSDVNVRNKNGRTSLLYACRFGSVKNVEALISFGADVFTVDNDNNSVLHHASFSRKESTEKINVLLNFDLNVNAQNIDGTTALHIACHRNNFAIVKVLIRNNADVTIKDNEGFDVLYYANSSMMKGIADLLTQDN